MIYTDGFGRKCKATDAELQAYDEANGCERVPAKALDSLVALSGALLLIERNNELLEKTARKFGAWTLLRTAQGMLKKSEVVKHGRWEKGGYAYGETEWKCSVCGGTEWRIFCDRMKFCTLCGAKLDGGADDDNKEM